MKYYYEAEMMLELLAERGCAISPLLLQLEEDQFDDIFTDKEKGENNYKLFVEFLKFADQNEIYYFDDVLELMKDEEALKDWDILIEAAELYEETNYETRIMKLAEVAFLKNGSPESVMKMIKLKTMFA